MNVLVTGGRGFLGTHLVDLLRTEGIEPNVPLREEYDLTRADEVERLFRAGAPDLVIHLAAEVGGIGANTASPGRYWYANLAMGLNILEESRKSGVQKLVLLGTVCSYPKETPVPFREEDFWSGYPEESNAPYGVAKKALLTGAQAYREQYGLNSIYVVPVNLYGPRDNFDLETSHVIPALIRKMVEATDRGEARVELWGDGSPTREFLFVADCVEAIWLAAQRYESGEPVNLGSGEEISIRELAGLIAEITGFEGEVAWDSSKPGGQPRRRLEVSRADELFGFRARTSLREGLERTVTWYSEHGRRSVDAAGRSAQWAS
jgi:GDP-L-fucose synthase